MMPLRNSRALSVFGSLLIVVFGIDGASAEEPERSEPLRESLANDNDIIKNSEAIRRQSAALRARLERDTGICASKNFSVMCTAEELDSRDLLAKAESWRRQIASELLGAELPEGSEFALIHVQLSANVDEGLTMLMDRPEQGHHRVWLTTSKERALGSTLAHEIAHLVLRAGFPRACQPGPMKASPAATMTQNGRQDAARCLRRCPRAATCHR